MAASKTKQAATSAATEPAAERKARAAARLDDVQGQVSEALARVSAADKQLAAIAEREREAAAKVAECERAQTAAKMAAVEAQARALVAQGTDGEADAERVVASATAKAAEAAQALSEARKMADAIGADAKTERETATQDRQRAADEAVQLGKLLTALERQVAEAHAAAGREELAAAMEERAAILERIDGARSELADALAALDTHRASIADRFTAWPALAESHEVTQLDVSLFGASREILQAFVDFCELLQRHAGVGDASYGPNRMSDLFAIPETQIGNLLMAYHGVGNHMLDWRINAVKELAAKIAAIEADPTDHTHREKLEARHGARRVARHLAAQQAAQRGA